MRFAAVLYPPAVATTSSASTSFSCSGSVGATSPYLYCMPPRRYDMQSLATKLLPLLFYHVWIFFLILEEKRKFTLLGQLL